MSILLPTEEQLVFIISTLLVGRVNTGLQHTVCNFHNSMWKGNLLKHLYLSHIISEVLVEIIGYLEIELSKIV